MTTTNYNLTSPHMPRNVVTDAAEGLVRVVATATADTTNLINPGAYSTSYFHVRNHSNVLMRVWSSVQGGTVDVKLYGWPADGPNDKAGGTLTQGKGRIICYGTFTCNGSATTASVCPATGEPCTGTFYEASSVSWTFRDDNGIVEHPSSSVPATGYEKQIIVDTLGDAYLYPQPYAISGSGTAVIALKVIN